ncbi:MFS transporter [Kineosporia sp. NBRC 101731]|uniref:MFS transporter n=1 Tax=Kineosporia sp. NBRC 101731 TaxID=3032199 RepID=UPI00249FB882|nr:MFS transporter [Kineosporia sp. NBRC 101731]GLY31725.1 MFS transporter [Kineosporia sp. NBRC 101731]
MRRSPWSTLAVLALAQFMVVLDVTIVNVALPDMQTDLGFSTDSLQWVISAYTLVFGGFLLLGGRAGDLLGRRRLFVAGLVVFGLASLAGGFAQSPNMLIALRAVQGLGGAMLSPGALSILTVTFAAGRDRNIALGIWGGLAGLGGTLGVVAGGFLVDDASWRWVFFVNVPVAVALIVITPLIVRESRVQNASGGRTFDLPGALLATTGTLALTYGVIRAEPLGWSDPEVFGSLIAAVVLLAGFVGAESRSTAPLVPLRMFRSRSLSLSSVQLGLNGAAFLSMFFLAAIFLQQVRGRSAVETGVQFLPMGLAAIVGATLASALVTRIGTRPVHLAGAVMSVAGLLLLTTAGADGSYAAELLPGFTLFGFGIMWVGVPGQISAVSEVDHSDAGAASGLVSAGYQIGGVLGLAVVNTLSTSLANSRLAEGADPQTALVDAFHRGILVAAAFAAANAGLALVQKQRVPDAEELAEAVPV